MYCVLARYKYRSIRLEAPFTTRSLVIFQTVRQRDKNTSCKSRDFARSKKLGSSGEQFLSLFNNEVSYFVTFRLGFSVLSYVYHVIIFISINVSNWNYATKLEMMSPCVLFLHSCISHSYRAWRCFSQLTWVSNCRLQLTPEQPKWSKWSNDFVRNYS